MRHFALNVSLIITLVPVAACAQDMSEWVEVGQEGKIVTWTVVHRDHVLYPHKAPFAFALIQHFYVTAQGNECNYEFSVQLVSPAEQGRTKTERKPQHFHAAAPGHPEVSELVHRYKDGESKNGNSNCI